STLVLSFLISNIAVFAQNFPTFIVRIPDCEPLFVQENAYTYEYSIVCYVNGVIQPLRDSDYYLVTEINANFRKGLNRNTFSYELMDQSSIQLPSGQYTTRFEFRL